MSLPNSIKEEISVKESLGNTSFDFNNAPVMTKSLSEKYDLSKVEANFIHNTFEAYQRLQKDADFEKIALDSLAKSIGFQSSEQIPKDKLETIAKQTFDNPVLNINTMITLAKENANNQKLTLSEQTNLDMLNIQVKQDGLINASTFNSLPVENKKQIKQELDNELSFDFKR